MQMPAQSNNLILIVSGGGSAASTFPLASPAATAMRRNCRRFSAVSMGSLLSTRWHGTSTTGAVSSRYLIFYPVLSLVTHQIISIPIGLMSYGPNVDRLFRRAAEYVINIFRGAKLGNLPKACEQLEIL